MYDENEKQPLSVASGKLCLNKEGEFDPVCDIILTPGILKIIPINAENPMYNIPIKNILKIQRYYTSNDKDEESYNVEMNIIEELIEGIKRHPAFNGDFMDSIVKKHPNKKIYLKIQFSDDDNKSRVIFFKEPRFNGIVNIFNKYLKKH